MTLKRPRDVVVALPPSIPAPSQPYATDAARLAESGGAESLASPAFLLTLFVPDRAGILIKILETLSAAIPKRADLIRLGIWDFKVESSVTASLSEVAVVALVIRPAFEAGSAWLGSRLSADRIETIAEVISDEVTQALGPAPQPGAPALGGEGDQPLFEPVDDEVVRSVDADLTVARVRPLGYASESVLYAGKYFREIRFGLRRGGSEAAQQCGQLLRDFATVLKAREYPIAYVHYPHRWNSYGDSSLDWLRVAYAADLDAGNDSAIEIEAWKLAREHDVALVAYDPSLPQRYVSDRFARLHDVESNRETAGMGRPAAPYPRVGLCAEGLARTGLVADLLNKAGEVLIEGCTVAVLHGRTVANLILTHPSASSLERVLRDQFEAEDGKVERFDVSSAAQVIPRQGSQNSFTFWLAWISPDRPGAVLDVLNVLRNQFEGEGLAPPNIVYGVSRVLVGGRSCVAKFKFSCDMDDASAFGLLDGQGGLDTNSVSTSRGATELRDSVIVAVGHISEEWQPPNLESRGHPVRVTGSEPHEEPWGSLGLPILP